MRYIVLDLEWNITSSRNKKGKTSTADNRLIPNEEIIEIGAWKLDGAFQVIDSFETNVKAQFSKKMHRHVSRVTNRGDASLQTGIPFPEAIEKFSAWCKAGGEEDLLFSTWSNNDLRPWANNFEAHDIAWPNGMRFFDVQRLFALAQDKTGHNQTSIATALEELEIEQELRLHRAVNDAYYTARIFQELIKVISQDESFPTTSRALFDLLYSHSFDITINYRDRFNLRDIYSVFELTDIADETAWLCPECKTELTLRNPWRRSKGGQKMTTLASCDKHKAISIALTTYKSRKQEDLKLNIFKVKADIRINYPL